MHHTRGFEYPDAFITGSGALAANGDRDKRRSRRVSSSQSNSHGLIPQPEIEAGVRGGGARRAIRSKMATQIMSEDFARLEAHAAKTMTTRSEIIIYEMLTQ